MPMSPSTPPRGSPGAVAAPNAAPGYPGRGALDEGHARGDFAASLRLAEHLIDGDGALAVDSFNAACALTRLGRNDQAFARLHEAIDRGWTDHQLLDRDVDLASLRGQVDWIELRTRLDG